MKSYTPHQTNARITRSRARHQSHRSQRHQRLQSDPRLRNYRLTELMPAPDPNHAVGLDMLHDWPIHDVGYRRPVAAERLHEQRRTFCHNGNALLHRSGRSLSGNGCRTPYRHNHDRCRTFPSMSNKQDPHMGMQRSRRGSFGYPIHNPSTGHLYQLRAGDCSECLH